MVEILGRAQGVGEDAVEDTELAGATGYFWDAESSTTCLSSATTRA